MPALFNTPLGVLGFNSAFNTLRKKRDAAVNPWDKPVTGSAAQDLGIGPVAGGQLQPSSDVEYERQRRLRMMQQARAGRPVMPASYDSLMNTTGNQF